MPCMSDLSDAAQRAFPAYVMARHDLSVGDAPPFDHAFEKIIDEEFLAVLRRGHARPPPFGRHGPAGDDPPLLFAMQDAVRSEARRVGQEWFSTGSIRGSPNHYKK